MGAAPNAPAEDGHSVTGPRLRFPEFRAHWQTRRLDTIAQLITERAGDRAITPYTVTSGIGLVSQKERYGRTIAGNAFQNYYVIHRNDFAYNKSATKAYPQGYIARFVAEELGAVPNSIFTCFRADPDYVSTAYLDYLFTGNLHGRWLRRRIEVSARAHGSLSVDDADLMSLPIPVPTGAASLLEQEKIADCMTSLDQIIAAQERKVKALKIYKRGMVQHLFPPQGEVFPRLRFPEFRDAGAWRYEPIDALAKITTGDKDTQDKVDDGKYPFFVRSQTVQRIDSYAIEGEAVLTSGDGVGVGDDYHYIDGRFNFHQRVYCIYDFRPDISGRYFFSYFSEYFGARVRQLSAKNSVDSVRRAMIAEMPVALPDSPEQARIASCLSSLDEVIAAQEARLATLRDYKCGLLQQLLPSPEGA